MKNKILKYILLLFCVGHFASCENEFLTQVNPNEIASDNFWQNLNDTQAGLNAAYASLRNYYIFSFVESSCRADMGWPGYGRPAPTANSIGRDYYYLAYSATDIGVQNKWEANYIGIFRANQVIEALNRIKNNVDPVQWKLQMAEARFLRGLFHFYLHSDFNNGEIIIRESVPRALEDFNKNVSSSAEVIEFFRKDLQYAYDNLPYKYASGAANQGKATKGAAATILGTSYLYQNEILAAKGLFDDVIKNPAYGYSLETDTTKLFTTKGEFNKESIFEIAYSSTLRPDLNVWNELSMSNRLSFYSTNVVGCLVPSWLAYAYKSEQMDTLDMRNYYSKSTAPTVKLKRHVPLRASAMVALVEDEQSVYYGSNPNVTGKYGATTWGPSMYKKFTNHDIVKSESELPRGTLASGKNFTVNRLAEVYLMNAECLIKLGKVDSALMLMNDIRKRWALQLLGPDKNDGRMYDGVTYTAETLMDRLMYLEKPLELSVEGNSIRWKDLRRWGIIKKNYERLASSVYYFVDYKSPNTNLNKQKVSLVLDPGTQANVIVDYEYDITVNNYIPAIHDYLPIPLSEITSNSALKK